MRPFSPFLPPNSHPVSPRSSLVKLLLDDLYGEAAEKKEVEEIATKMKETRATRSYASFELLGSVIQFVPNINLLVPPLHTAVLAAPGGVESLKNLTVAREVLRHASLGLSANPSVELQPLCVYVRGMLVTHLPQRVDASGGAAAGAHAARSTGEDERRHGTVQRGPGGKKIKPVKGGDRPEDRLWKPDAKRQKLKERQGPAAAAAAAADHSAAAAAAAVGGTKAWAPVGTVLAPTVEAGVTAASGRSPLAHELLAFGIGLLTTALRRGRFSPGDSSHLGLLEPLLPLLQRAMRVDSDAVVSLALRTVGNLMSFPLPSLPTHATSLLDRTLQILKRAANTRGTELVGIGIKVVTTLLRKPPVRQLADGRAWAEGGAEGGGGGGATATKRGRDDGKDKDGHGENGNGASHGGGDDDEDDDDDEEDMRIMAAAGGAKKADGDDDNEGGDERETMTDVEKVLARSGLGGPRVGGGATLGESQLRWLVSFVSVHLEDVALQSSLFGLLRVIFGRKFVLAELYDLVLVLGDMVVQADAPGVRNACSSLFLTFLLRYPLGPKRLQQHLNFLVTNLGYPVEHGRLSLLNLVTSVIAQLPLPVLHRQADLLLLPLITRLVNDESAACRAAVGVAITKLLARTCDTRGDAECAEAREKLVKLLRAWYADRGSASLGRAAAQLAGLAVDAIGAPSLAPSLVPLVIECCQREVAAQEDGDADEEATGMGGGGGGGEGDDGKSAADDRRARWQPVYYSLRALLKLASADDTLLVSSGCAPLWPPLHLLLLHPHAWVRATAARLLGMLFAAVQPAALLAATDGIEASDANEEDAAAAGGMLATMGKKAKKAKKGGHVAAGAAVGASDPSPPKFLCRRGALLELADSMLQQLHSPLIAEGAAAQALKNLLWVSTAVVQCPGLAPISCKASLPGRATRVHGAAGANNGGRGRGGGDDDANDDDDNSDEEHQQQPSDAHGENGEHGGGGWRSWPLESIASRLVPLLMTPGHVRGGTAMRWYAAIATQLSVDQLSSLLHALLGPIVRASEDMSGKVHLAVKELAAEALQLVQRKADPPAFVAAYTKVKEAQRVARRERKQREALEAVYDPAGAAQKRMAKNLGKRNAKKRKLQESKRAKSAYGGGIGLGGKNKAAASSGTNH